MKKYPILLALLTGNLLAQGPLTPPAGSPAPTMRSLQEIWDRMGTLESQNAALRTQSQLLGNIIQGTLPPTTQFLWEKSLIDPAGAFASSLAFAPSGQPNVAYQGNDKKLRLATFNGSTWQLSVVNNTVGNGSYCSLAFAPNGQPAIAYYDKTNTDLYYSIFNGSTWSISAVDNVGDVGSYCTLKFLPSGNAAIAYYDETNGDLKYATSPDGSTWTLETPDSSGNVGVGASLSISPSGKPGISYYDSTLNRVNLVEKGVSSWSLVSITPALPNAGLNTTSLAYRADGTPFLAFHTSPSSEIFVLKRPAPPAWAGGTTGITGPGQTSITLSTGGLPIIGYRASSGGHQSIAANKSDGSWLVTVLENETSTSPNTGAPSIAIAPNFQPAASFSTNAKGLYYTIMTPFALP